LDFLLKKADRVILYDHHPSHGRDIEADESYVEETGSTVTVILKKMKDADYKPDKNLATLMMLGLYEDTGLLSFSSTTPEDIRTASVLLEYGADLNEISEYIKRDLSKEQVFVLNELLVNLFTLNIQGTSVGLSSASSDRYIGEIAQIVHRIMDMESMDALFVAVRVGERIAVIGRSRADEIDCASVMTRFGGGGHPSAASAIIKKMTLTETADMLKTVISETVRPVKHARDIMTGPVKTVPHNGSFETAMDLFMKYNLNMMPVTDNDGLPVGLISRRDILQGIKHGLKNEPVSSIMQIEFRTVEPEVPYYIAEELMLSHNQKMLPVVKDGRLEGVITRTDLLRLMHEEISKLPRYQHGGMTEKVSVKLKNIRSLLKDCMPERVANVLEEIGMLAAEMGLNTYLVGGVVRDLLMENTNMDIDIVVEGDAPRLAKRYAVMKGAKVSEHYKFKTAVVIFKDGFRVDFATSRTEFYTNPAAAPQVENASIRNDLYRRDFSINAMALKLTGEDFGMLLDFFSGQRDIQDKKIRVLHSLSFVDDPSRCLRGIRFAVRYGFTIGPHTEKLLKHAVSLNLLDRVIGQRMYLELKYILGEDNYIDALAMMKKYDLLKFFHEKLSIDDTKLERFALLKKINGWYAFQFEDRPENWLSRFFVFFYELNKTEMKKLSARFELSGKQYEELAGQFYSVKNAVWRLKRLDDIKPSAVTEIFEEMSVEAVIAASVCLGQEFDWLLKEYFTVYRFTEPVINGNDLKNMGLAPSPVYADILHAVKKARLDNLVHTREAELVIARKIAKEKGVLIES
jgi:tRNA nucleotidyltransferase (CCA-adding enzyme)